MTDVLYRPDVTAKMTQALNNSQLNNQMDAGMFREPRFFVYLYNIGQKQHTVRRPPHVPLLVLKACPEDQEYIEVAKLAHPFEQADRDVDTGDVRMRFLDARRVALDICCPDAASMDSTLPLDSHSIDLRGDGIFFSPNKPPLESEVKAAHDRREKKYRARLEMLTALEYTNPKELMERINEDDRLAADYFDEEFSWHKSRKRKEKPSPVVAKVDCPYCGESIKAGIAFHKTDEGEFCVLDWKRAYESGRVTKKQIPLEKRWPGFTE